MSDNARKDVTSQATEEVTPDNQKSMLDKASESVSGTADKAAGSVQSESDKSATQKLSDTARSGTDDTQAKTGGIAETVSKNVTAAKDTVTQTASDVASAVTGSKKE